MNNFLSKFPTSFATLSTNEMANEQRKNGFNSSIMTWTKTADLSFLYVLLKKHFDIISKYIYKFDHWLEVSRARHWIEVSDFIGLQLDGDSMC
jgi:hypothetical protein